MSLIKGKKVLRYVGKLQRSETFTEGKSLTYSLNIFLTENASGEDILSSYQFNRRGAIF